MFKKIIIGLILVLSIFFIDLNSLNACNTLDGCLQGSQLVDPKGDVIIESGFKIKLLEWITNIGGFLGLMAIGAIVWGGFMMVISSGEEEKIKKAKDMIKWATLGFLGIILASSLIALVVNFMYSLD